MKNIYSSIAKIIAVNTLLFAMVGCDDFLDVILHLLYLLRNIYGKNRILLHIRLITIQSWIAIQVILLILLIGVIYVRTMP